MASQNERKNMSSTNGVDTQKAKRKAVLSQLMVLSDTLKYSEEVVEIEENVNHYDFRLSVACFVDSIV